MPLNPHHPSEFGDLDGLHDAVVGATGDDQSITESFDGLMVERMTSFRSIGSHGDRRARLGLERDGVEDLAVSVDVLGQCSPEGDVHDLGTTADRQGGCVAIDEVLDRGQLHFVVLDVESVHVLRPDLLSVVRGIDVTPTVQDDRVASSDRLAQSVDDRRQRR